MSYILEALRRADAERERGRAPDLHARPQPAAIEVGPARARPLVWLVGGLAVGAVVAAWYVGSGRDERAATTPAPNAAGPEAGAATTTAAPALVSPTASAAPTPPDAPVAPPAETHSSSTLPALPPRPLVPPPAATPDRAAATLRAGVAVDASPPALGELPESMRRELPPLRVGGSVYSEQPAARLLILDGRVLREGEWLQPDLVVERIGVRDAVLRYRDRAFTLAY